MIGTMPALLVLGASGAIGRGVVAAAVAAGRPVIAVARDPLPLQGLAAEHPQADLTLLPASVASDGEAAALAERVRGRALAGVVAAVCGEAVRGRLLDQPAEFLRRTLDQDLLPHLFAARRLLPLLGDAGNAGYVLVGGPGGELPWAGYGHRSIATAALRMLARVLHDEARAMDVRVQLLTVDSPARTHANAGHACPQWPSALSIGRRALALVERAPGPAPVPAVVRHVERSSPSAFGSDDLDHVTVPRARVRATRVANDGGSRPALPQEADSAGTSLPPRCLHDARTLLQSVLDSRTAPRLVLPALPPPASGPSP